MSEKEKEIWKDISGFEGKYKISNYGNVYSLISDKALKNSKHSGGYLTVCLGRKNRRYVHRLVAEAFIPNPYNKPEVNHKFGNKVDNYYKNLEWSTPSENQLHSKEIGLSPIGENHPQAKLSNDDVKYIKENYKPFDRKFGAKPMSDKFGVAMSIISRIANGTRRINK